MKLKDKGSLVVYNVPQEVGQKLVAAGLADEVVAAPAPEPAYAEILWRVQDGAKVGDFLYPPEIFAMCSKCGNQIWKSSQQGTAHLTIQFRHRAGCPSVTVPGVVEQIPEHIVKEYQARWSKYQSLSKKKIVPPPLTTTNTADLDRRLMKAAGHKTREELILEAQMSVRRKG